MKKNYIIPVILSFCVLASNAAFAKNNNPFKRPPLDIRQQKFVEIKNELSLNEFELYDFNSIKESEDRALRPIVLELEARYLRLDELNEVKCKWYQRTCKKELKRDKNFIADDIRELKRQVWQKKEYYMVLYLNAATREQDLKLRQMIYNETKGKPQLW